MTTKSPPGTFRARGYTFEPIHLDRRPSHFDGVSISSYGFRFTKTFLLNHRLEGHQAVSFYCDGKNRRWLGFKFHRNWKPRRKGKSTFRTLNLHPSSGGAKFLRASRRLFLALQFQPHLIKGRYNPEQIQHQQFGTLYVVKLPRSKPGA